MRSCSTGEASGGRLGAWVLADVFRGSELPRGKTRKICSPETIELLDGDFPDDESNASARWSTLPLIFLPMSESLLPRFVKLRPLWQSLLS